LEPWELINLCLMMGKAWGSHQVLLAFLVMAAMGCIRFEHLQRSKFETKHDTWLEFNCSQGKSRKRGARPAYAWGLPNVTMQGQSLMCILHDFYRNEMPETSFLFPAVRLDAEDLWEITESTAFISNRTRKMSRARYLEILRGALLMAGTEVEKAKTSTFNCLRRCLPTLANTLELGTLELQAVGNWTEIPQGGAGTHNCAKSKLWCRCECTTQRPKSSGRPRSSSDVLTGCWLCSTTSDPSWP
jgi:hypothetical protein